MTYEYNTEELRLKLDNLLFKYWESLPEPKMFYTEWFYGEGGIRDILNLRHLEARDEV